MSTLFLCAHEHIYFIECAVSQNVLLPLLMVHFVTRMYYYLLLLLLLTLSISASVMGWFVLVGSAL